MEGRAPVGAVPIEAELSLAGWLCWLAVLQASNTLRCAAGDFEAQPGWESRQRGSNPTHSAAQQRSNAATPARPHFRTHSRARRHTLDAAAIRASTPPVALSRSPLAIRGACNSNLSPHHRHELSAHVLLHPNPLRCSAVIPQSTFSRTIHRAFAFQQPRAILPLPVFELSYRTQLTRFHLVILRRLAHTTCTTTRTLQLGPGLLESILRRILSHLHPSSALPPLTSWPWTSR